MPASNGLGQACASPRMSARASARCRLPPNTNAAFDTSARAAGANPSTPSSPMPTIASQRRGADAVIGLESAMRVLILGGTTEARLLAERLAPRRELAVTLSLAGRTHNPVPHPVPVRIGGFGGAEGLADHLAAERIDRLIDATHPYAAQMSENAARAAARANVPLLALRRAPWTAVDGD